MKKTYSPKFTIPVMAIALIMIAVVKFWGPVKVNSLSKIGFVGNDGIHGFNGSYHSIHGYSKHTLSPSKGSDGLEVMIHTESGQLHVTVTEKDGGKVIFEDTYSEEGSEESFVLHPEGKVIVEFEASKHSGSYKFKY